MKNIELKICITDISDALSLGQNTIVDSIMNEARDLVSNGGKVTIEHRYENANPDHLITYCSVDEIESWKERLNEVQQILDSSR